MANAVGSRRDPKLEAIRARGLAEHAPPEVAPLVRDLEDKTRRIHAGFLFDDTYGHCEAWSLLMKHLCATSSRNISADWKAFCNLLGFDRPIIQSIENVQPNAEDPVTNTLRAFCQRPDATIDLIVHALYQMGREDILLNISEPLNALADGVLRDHDDTNMTIDSGYTSRNSSDDCQDVIIIPKWLPNVPCLLKDQKHLANAFEKIDSALVLGTSTPSCHNISAFNTPDSSNTAMTSITSLNSIQISPLRPVENYPIEYNIPVRSEENSSVTAHPPPKRVVFLTFAQDGQAAAVELATVLRRPRGINEERCGVVILQEQLSMLNQDPVSFVQGCYCQADYIVPILTPGFLQSISPNSVLQHNANCVDANNVRLIYRLMVGEFTEGNCMNKRIRTIIPDSEMQRVRKSIAAWPIFQAFHRLSDGDKFAEKILRAGI